MRNLLKIAMKYLPTEKVSYCKFLGNTQTEIYTDAPSYANAEVLTASVQRVRQDIFEQFGLNMQKKYKIIFVSKNVKGVNEIQSPDKFIFQDRNWVVTDDVSDWYHLNGWRAVLVVAENDF